MSRDDRRVLTIVDTHYGGDVSRVVFAGIPRVPGATVAEKRDWLQHAGDALRRLLLYPPYGEPAMCANVIVDVDPGMDAQAGYVIMEAMGYPHFSGSNSICVATALLEGGRIAMDQPPAGQDAITQELRLEAPSGLVRALARHDGTHVHSVTVECDPAHVVERGLRAAVPGFGDVAYDLVWSGCHYAVVEAADLGFVLSEAEQPALVEFGDALCRAATPDLDLVHPQHGDTGPLAFVAVAGDLEQDPAGRARVRTATYVHPGVLCSCPTGTGTAARLAQWAEAGIVGTGDEVVTVSPSGSEMVGRVLDSGAGAAATRVSVTGEAFTLGRTELVVNRRDPLVDIDGIWPLLDTTDGWVPPAR